MLSLLVRNSMLGHVKALALKSLTVQSTDIIRIGVSLPLQTSWAHLLMKIIIMQFVMAVCHMDPGKIGRRLRESAERVNPCLKVWLANFRRWSSQACQKKKPDWRLASRQFSDSVSFSVKQLSVLIGLPGRWGCERITRRLHKTTNSWISWSGEEREHLRCSWR